MSSGVASTSASAYSLVPPPVGGAPATYASASTPAAAGAGSGTQQYGSTGLNADSVAPNVPQRYNPLIRAEMIAPAPPANVASSDSAQIFKIGNSGLVAITVAGVVIGVTSFVGIQAAYEMFGQRHKHDYWRIQKHQEDLNNAAKSGTQRHDVSDENFERSATANKAAVLSTLRALPRERYAALLDASRAMRAAPDAAPTDGITELRALIADQLARLDRAHPSRAVHIARQAEILQSARASRDGAKTGHDVEVAKLPADYAVEHKAFLAKAVDPIAHAFGILAR